MGNLYKLKVIGISVVVLLVVIVILQNTRPVETKLLFLTLTMPNAALLCGTLVIGFAIGVLTAGPVARSATRVLPDWPPQRRPSEI
ncbi:MAG: LapA family protein [Planctomycetaceae bacterium]|nr:MAG: LapA family protein [Planctomycetaceae bacterium]